MTPKLLMRVSTYEECTALQDESAVLSQLIPATTFSTSKMQSAF